MNLAYLAGAEAMNNAIVIYHKLLYSDTSTTLRASGSQLRQQYALP